MQVAIPDRQSFSIICCDSCKAFIDEFKGTKYLYKSLLMTVLSIGWRTDEGLNRPIYNPFKHVTAHAAVEATPGVLAPGGEWLYFQVYCHPSRANELLLGPIRALP